MVGSSSFFGQGLVLHVHSCSQSHIHNIYGSAFPLGNLGHFIAVSQTKHHITSGRITSMMKAHKSTTEYRQLSKSVHTWEGGTYLALNLGDLKFGYSKSLGLE